MAAGNAGAAGPGCRAGTPGGWPSGRRGATSACRALRRGTASACWSRCSAAVGRLRGGAPETRAVGVRANSPSWPVELRAGEIVLRPTGCAPPRPGARQPAQSGLAARVGGSPIAAGTRRPDRGPAGACRLMVRRRRSAADVGRRLAFVDEDEGRLVGKLAVAGITRGSMCSGDAASWVDAGGVRPRRDRRRARPWPGHHGFGTVGGIGLEVSVSRRRRAPRRRVVEKLGPSRWSRAADTCTATEPGGTTSSSRSPRKRSPRGSCGDGTGHGSAVHRTPGTPAPPAPAATPATLGIE
ncbi:hypothetical protein STENM327S_05560 [Streptomyces tendae]